MGIPEKEWDGNCYPSAIGLKSQKPWRPKREDCEVKASLGYSENLLEKKMDKRADDPVE